MIQNILINEKYLKEFSPIPLNYNLKEVHNYIKMAEQIWVEPIIGYNFYQELIYQVKNNQVTEENSTLLVEALYPLLGYAVALESLPFLWSHISEVGITLGHSENSDSLSLKDMTYIEGHLRRQVEVRKDYLIKWLDSHCESFPLYHPTNCGCNSCCANGGKLNEPNPLFEIYTVLKRCTDLI